MAFDTSGFGLAAPQEQVVVPSLANLAPYAPDFRGVAWKPANIQPTGSIGDVLSTIGKGIEVAYKSAQDEKKELRKYALEQAKMAASEESAARKEASAEQRHQQSLAMQAAQIGVSQGHLDLARQKQQAGGGADYSEWMPKETSDRVEAVTDGIEGQERPVFFQPQQLDIMTPPPESGSVSFDGAPLGATPTQGDQRFASLSDLSLLPDQYKTASVEGLPPTAPTPSLPYALQGGVPRALSEVESPDTRELYPKTELKTASFPTYGTYRESKPAATPRASSPIVSFPVTDPSGNVIGYSYYDRAAKKLIPGSYVSETKKEATGSLANLQIPQDFKPTGVSVNAKGEASYTFGPEKEGKASAPLLQDQLKILTNIEGANTTLDSIEEKLKSVGSSTGPVVGYARGMNPYDVVAQSVENMVNSLVPGLARGVFGEVGVLTDKDVERYKKLIPNMRTDPAVAKQIMQDLRTKLKGTKKANLGIWEKAGYNVGGFQETQNKEKNELDSLIRDIDSAKDKNSPDVIAKKKRAEELYLLQNKK
jgi:hypothetical protein